MAVVLVLIEIVCAHDAPGFALLDGSLEAWQVDFVQGAVADDDIHLVAVFLVVVQAVVFHTAGHTDTLQPLNVAHDHAGGEVGVFTHVFEVAATQRCAVDVHARSQNHGFAAIERFFAQGCTVQERK